MTTVDDLTMGMLQNINVDRLVEAKRNGNLISYYAEVSNRILGINTPDTQIHGESATETRSNSSSVRPPTPEPRRARRPIFEDTTPAVYTHVDDGSTRVSIDDTVKVARL